MFSAPGPLIASKLGMLSFLVVSQDPERNFYAQFSPNPSESFENFSERDNKRRSAIHL